MNELVVTTRNLIKNKQKFLILVRSCENLGSLSGCLNGWIDAKLSDYGRKQARHLSVEYFVNFDNRKDFESIYISDLLRSRETAEICLGHDQSVQLQINSDLREIYYGSKEGLFYDGLPKEEKALINKKDYKFPNGESWMDVKYRCIKLINNVIFKNTYSHLLFTHGAFISSLLYSKGIKKMLPSGSICLVSLNEELVKQNTELDKGYMKAALNEFSKKWMCSDEEFNSVVFNRYNPSFEEFLEKSVKGIEGLYTLPDLSENFL
jgi:broad specificity phosphatase PhoE